MQLDLSFEEAAFLSAQVHRRLSDLDYEVAHTEQRDFRAALGRDAELLRRIDQRLDQMVHGTKRTG